MNSPAENKAQRVLYLLSLSGQPVRAGKAIPHTHYCYEGDKKWTPVEAGGAMAGGQPVVAKDSEDSTPLLKEINP